MGQQIRDYLDGLGNNLHVTGLGKCAFTVDLNSGSDNVARRGLKDVQSLISSQAGRSLHLRGVSSSPTQFNFANTTSSPRLPDSRRSTSSQPNTSLSSSSTTISSSASSSSSVTPFVASSSFSSISRST